MKKHSAGMRLLSVRDGAAFYGVGISTYWRWLKKGLIPSPIRIGGRTLWCIDDLEEHLNQLKNQRANHK
jgi:predicted DNA-binding transcriptional regulator AlpA